MSLNTPTKTPTKGAVLSFFKLGGYREPLNNPILQALHIKRVVKDEDNSIRVILKLSDGEYFIQAMLSPTLIHLVANDVIQRNAFVQVHNYEAKLLNDKRILLVSNLSVLSQNGTEELKVGNALNVNEYERPSAKSDLQPKNVSGQQFYGGNSKPVKPGSFDHGQQSVMDESHMNIQSIEGINPYTHFWTIRARLAKKSPLREWQNQKGSGKLFSATFMDESGDIRATIFHSVGDNFERWNELLQEGSVYFVSTPCEVKFANKKFNNTSNDYELVFSRDTVVEASQDQANVPTLRYNFILIGDLEKTDTDSIIDCIGILKEVGDTTEIATKKTGRMVAKRELTILDDTRHQIRLTIWGDAALNFTAPLESVVAFQGVRVSDFNGRSLSLMGSTGGFTIDPDIEQAHRLKGWYDAQGRSEVYESFTSAKTGIGSRTEVYKTIAQIKEEGLGFGDKPDYFTLNATVDFLRVDSSVGGADRPIYYESCEKCNKKVTEIDQDQWHCASCDKDWPRPVRRYILNIAITDYTGALYISAFDEAGAMILGKSADDIHALRQNDNDQFKSIVDEAMCRSYVFKCRAKTETYNDEQKQRISVTSAAPINFVAEAKRLQELIKAYDDDNMFVQ